jgi:hypothetical protein
MSTSRKNPDPVLAAIQGLSHKIDQVEKGLRCEMSALRTELRGDIAEVRGDIVALRTDMDAGFTDVKQGLAKTEARVEAVNESMSAHFAETNAKLDDVADRTEKLEGGEPPSKRGRKAQG